MTKLWQHWDNYYDTQQMGSDLVGPWSMVVLLLTAFLRFLFHLHRLASVLSIDIPVGFSCFRGLRATIRCTNTNTKINYLLFHGVDWYLLHCWLSWISTNRQISQATHPVTGVHTKSVSLSLATPRSYVVNYGHYVVDWLHCMPRDFCMENADFQLVRAFHF